MVVLLAIIGAAVGGGSGRRAADGQPTTAPGEGRRSRAPPAPPIRRGRRGRRTRTGTDRRGHRAGGRGGEGDEAALAGERSASSEIGVTIPGDALTRRHALESVLAARRQPVRRLQGADREREQPQRASAYAFGFRLIDAGNQYQPGLGVVFDGQSLLGRGQSLVGSAKIEGWFAFEVKQAPC
ncbi:MAG: hypothetical protein U0531_20600 [Dehalococcoidia bacterium]